MAHDNAAVRAVLDGSLFYDVVESTIRDAFSWGLRQGEAEISNDSVRRLYEDWRVYGPGGNLPGAQIFATELREARKQAALDEQAAALAEREAALAEMKRQAEQRATVFPCDLCGRSLQGERCYERVTAEPRGLWHLACWEGLSKYLPNGAGA